MPKELLTDDLHDVRGIVRIYRQTRLEVVDRLNKAKTEASLIRQRAILAEIDNVLNQAAQETRAWAERAVPTIYKDGADDAIKGLEKIGAPIKVRTGFSVLHQDAIRALVDDTFLSFAQGLNTVRNTSRGTLSMAAKVQIRDEIGKGVIQGSSLRDTKAAVTQIIKDRGVSALQDRAGKNWDLETYAEMLVRTKQREIFNGGTGNRLIENGYDLAQISDHGADDSCADWEGEIISLTGATKGYPTLADVENDDTHMFGPNCRHTYTAFVPGLSDR